MVLPTGGMLLAALGMERAVSPAGKVPPQGQTTGSLPQSLCRISCREMVPAGLSKAGFISACGRSQHGHCRAPCGPADSRDADSPPWNPRDRLRREKAPGGLVQQKVGAFGAGRWLMWGYSLRHQGSGAGTVGVLPHHRRPPRRAAGPGAGGLGREPTRTSPRAALKAASLAAAARPREGSAGDGEQRRGRAEPSAAATSRHRLHDTALP